ncbi:hypothetical protein Clacol_006853 [Clathrus columnatus]|uniref:BTB domain-containing protein n=1 Tax=Clathrus columnatus TaxID=1419009 RepID=A0AAV5AL07_9AGAM|nr:hypothetical protein Clacol_006853 [Clathrus columnatus]
MPDSSVITTPTRTHHPQYYFEDGIVFLVENTYYKVPRRKLCLSSSVFQDLFSLPPDSSFPAEGESDEHPIILQGISNIDFERLLTYLYPLTNEYTHFTKEWNFDYWHSILKVAHTYMMDDICTQIIDALSTMSFPDPLTMIRCGLKFNHPTWIRQGYSELVFRSCPLTVEEAQALGLENSILCAAARETYRSPGGNSINKALDKWFTGENKLPCEPYFEPESPVYDLRAEPKLGKAEGREAFLVARHLLFTHKLNTRSGGNHLDLQWKPDNI